MRRPALGDKVTFAFVYGSMAAGTERPGSDVDAMVHQCARQPVVRKRTMGGVVVG